MDATGRERNEKAGNRSSFPTHMPSEFSRVRYNLKTIDDEVCWIDSIRGQISPLRPPSADIGRNDKV